MISVEASRESRDTLRIWPNGRVMIPCYEPSPGACLACWRDCASPPPPALLRGDPYRGEALDKQFDNQLRQFLAAGALQVDRQEGVVYLSRVFLWFGADVVRPHRMPSFLPAQHSRILASLLPWIDGRRE